MTHAERVLNLLSDGKPHSHHEGYALRVMLHSRVADLRKQGHDIRCWREGDSYIYQLVNAPPPNPALSAETVAGPEAVSVSALSEPGSTATPRENGAPASSIADTHRGSLNSGPSFSPEGGGPVQLSLTEEAA